MLLTDDPSLVVRELRESDAGFLVRWLSDSRVFEPDMRGYGFGTRRGRAAVQYEG